MTNGIAILGAAAGAGKSGVSVGLNRILRKQGIHVEAFKPVGVVNLRDSTCPEDTLWKRAAFYNCYSADLEVNWWNSPVVVVPHDTGNEGSLYIAGDRVGEVAIAGEDAVDFSSAPIKLQRLARNAILEGIAKCRALSEFVLQEGAGCAGALDPASDLANVFAVRSSSLPVVLLAKASKVEHTPSLVGACSLIEPLIGQPRGFVLNQVKDRTAAASVAARVRGATAMTYLGALGTISFPADFDGSREHQRALDDRWGAELMSSGVGRALLEIGGITI